MLKSMLTFEKAWLPCLILFIAACQNEAEKSARRHPNKFSDSVLVAIYEHQDHRNTEALLHYLDDDNPAYRAAAAEAFGSVQDSVAIPMLAVLLNDADPKVRKAAAYALGQTYDSSAMKPLSNALLSEDSSFVRKELFEALGKVVTQSNLAQLNTIATTNDFEATGQAWGLYRAGLRNVYDQLSIEIAVELVDTTHSYETRLGAAHFLSRTSNLDLTKYSAQLIKSATQDPAPNVRMATTLALKNALNAQTVQVLSEVVLNDVDYRVKINALRALHLADFSGIKEAVYKSLEDQNVNVSIAAASLIGANGDDAAFIAELALKHPITKVKALLLGTALKLSDEKNDIADQVKRQYEEATDPYYKAALLGALSSHLSSYEFVITKIFEAERAAISTAGANALVAMRAAPDFPDELKPAFADVFRQMMLTGDIAMIAVVSGVLSNPELNFVDEYDDYQFLYKAREMLTLPKDNEALQVLNKTIALFEGKENLPETKNTFNNPIDWELVKTIDKNQQVLINTVKGTITLRLLVEKAPGSVANFYTLAKDGYFDGKNFHRVVPNFVVQGGCNRGDGYGGENFSIRSEFANLRYETGSVGMASAGKDTEGTQWFITHSPTPHLDGRYTIFAHVEDGMDVVHAMEEGDVIKSVEIAKRRDTHEE